MFEIKKVINEEMAIICDNLLTKLIQSERIFDSNVKETFVVNNNYTRKYDKGFNVLFIAYADDKPVGYIYGYIKEQKGDFVYESVGCIDALYVLEDYRKKGIATALINKFYDWCSERGIKFVTIGVYKDNIDAYNLYSKHGFETNSYYMLKELAIKYKKF